jgi:hypothetical protein
MIKATVAAEMFKIAHSKRKRCLGAGAVFSLSLSMRPPKPREFTARVARLSADERGLHPGADPSGLGRFGARIP